MIRSLQAISQSHDVAVIGNVLAPRAIRRPHSSAVPRVLKRSQKCGLTDLVCANQTDQLGVEAEAVWGPAAKSAHAVDPGVSELHSG